MRCISLLAASILGCGLPAQSSSPSAGLQHPDFSSTGQIAVSMAGNLWIITQSVGAAGSGSPASGVNWRQVTSAAGVDLDPHWTADAKALLFSSNREGSFDLYRVPVDGASIGEVERLTSAEADEREPTQRANGDIIFVRGRSGETELFLRQPDGNEIQLTESPAAETSPVFSPDGKTLAYVALGRRSAELRLLDLVTAEGADSLPEAKKDRLVLADARVESLAWSPDGERIAFGIPGGEGGVWLTDLEGSYRNLLSSTRSSVAWSPDGGFLALAALPRNEPAYNGDPDRVGLRQYGPLAARDALLWFVKAPAPPSGTDSEIALAAPSLALRQIAHFDRLVDRLAAQYPTQERSRWLALAAEHRPAAEKAKSPAELDAAIFALLQARPDLRAEARGRAAVSSAHPQATAAGVEVLSKGGNVVEAAIAVSFALGVVEPDASGIGGYGEMMVFLQGMSEPVCIEFMTRVPAAAKQAPARGPGERGSARSAAQAVNVPGTVAGMRLAFENHGSGKVEWSELLQPAIKLAEEGFVIDDALATTLARNRPRYRDSDAAEALYFPDGRALVAGDLLKNPDLTWTLKQIAEKGAKGFYEGEVAKRMIKDLRDGGSVMQSSDLKHYFAVSREPVKSTYRGHSIYSGSPPVTGGVGLVGKLSMLEQEDDLGSYLTDPGVLHRMIEAWKLAPSTSGRIADPGIWPVDLAPFSDKVAAKKTWERGFKAESSLTSDEIRELRRNKVAVAGPDLGVLDARTYTGTTAFAVADAAGNMVAVTQTLGTWGGNFHLSPGLGFPYNDKFRGVSAEPSRYGASMPLSRVGTVIAPTLVFKGRGAEKQPFVALGAAGNSWISAAVYQMVSGFIDQGLSPQEAIELPRFLVGGSRGGGTSVVQIEDGFAPGVLDKLRALGHELQRISLRGELRMGYAAAAAVLAGEAVAGADPRRSGAAGAVK